MGATLLFLWAATAAVGAGTDSVVGDVLAAAPAEHRLLIRKDKGGDVAVRYVEATVFLRTKPGATTLEGAAPVAPARGTLRGQVTDPSGAAVPAARVEVTGPGTKRRATSDARGAWNVDGLPPVRTRCSSRARASRPPPAVASRSSRAGRRRSTPRSPSRR